MPDKPTMPAVVLHDGVIILLDGDSYTLPPCSLATLQRHADGIDAFAKMGGDFTLSKAAISTILSVVFEALRRNYPDITADFVAESLGLDQLMPTFQAAMDVSGLMRRPPGQGSDGNATSTAADGKGSTLGESTGIASPHT